uniref:X1.C4.1 n=1 Tax=Schmidtea mediterranea TaxID=79327 RepID=V9XMQ9_SCHMD|nr:X1.C4.1 [Schmidtea mediterranea]
MKLFLLILGLVALGEVFGAPLQEGNGGEEINVENLEELNEKFAEDVKSAGDKNEQEEYEKKICRRVCYSKYKCKCA